MAKDVADIVGSAIGRVVREATQSLSESAPTKGKGSNGMKAGGSGLVAGLGLAALTPIAVKGAKKLAKGAGNSAKDAGSSVKDAVADKATGKVTDKLPGGSKSKGQPGVGKGRRMPIQQDIDIGASVST